MFVEFRNADDASVALVAMHNHPFDAKHQFKVNRFTDIERYEKLDETYIEPETEEYAPRVIISPSRPVHPLKFPALPRNTSEHGSPTPRVETNTSHTVGRTLKYIGTGNLPSRN